MDKKYATSSLLDIYKYFNKLPEAVILTGTDLTIPQIINVAKLDSKVEFTTEPEVLNRIRACYERMMQDVEDGIPIYGCNTGYGAQASRVLTNGSPQERINLAKMISEGIAHVDVTTGPALPQSVVRGAILIRINMLMRGVSAVKIDDLEIYRQILNHGITPIVGQYGGIGASGDLAHNGRVLSVARQLEGVRVIDKKGEIREAREALQEAGIPPLHLDPKAGLGLVNGDNFSTSLAALLADDTVELLMLSTVVGAMMVEVLKGTNRSFHPLISGVRPHPGQKEVADIYRYLLDGSKLAYQEMNGHKRRATGIKVQDGYSLRGISQYHGVNFDKIKNLLDIITINANSVSDNPLWVSPEFATEGEKPWQWVSGANFIAMNMVEVMDSLRKTMTQITKLNDRHLARLVDTHENNGLPANISDKNALTQCAFKGVQIQSGMFDVYSSLLSIPVSTFFGTHEESNQDITSHALTSGILGLELLRIVRYSFAQNLLAIGQAVDLRGGPEKLSPQTRPVYEFIRSKTKYVEKERPLNNEIEVLYESIVNGELIKVINSQVFHNYDV